MQLGFTFLYPLKTSENLILTENIINMIYKSKLLIDLLLLTNLMELLVINQSLSERRNVFVPCCLKLFILLVALQLAWVRTSPQLRWITRSGLALYLCRVSMACSKWSCRFSHVFQYKSGLLKC